MSIPGTLIPLFNSGAGAGEYTIDRSLRFNSADSAYLNRTPASSGNRKTWTWAGWVKRSKPGNTDHLFNASGYALLYFENNDTLRFDNGGAGSRLFTTQVFRDFSAWYHVVLVLDTTQSTSSERNRLYVNGTRITTFSTEAYPTQNSDYAINNNVVHQIGNWSTEYSSNYLADIYFIDGQALDPTSFGEFDATTGVWVPKTPTGLTYGTNGFHLDFADNSSAAALGYDAAGSNDWTVNNISATGGEVSVASATGALPIYNTTDTYGTTKGSGTRTDSNNSYIMLAVAMDGSNNGTTFTDESATIKGSGSAKTLTRTGAVTSTTKSKFYGSSGYFDASGDFITVSDAGDFAFGTGDFAIECWLNLNSAGTVDNPYSAVMTTSTTSQDSGAWVFGFSNSTNVFGFCYDLPGFNFVSTNYSAYLNKWTHVAATRSGSTLRLFINGQVVTSTTNSTNFSYSSSTPKIGQRWTNQNSYSLDGYMQDLRVYKGVAKYTSTFNPPTIGDATVIDSLRDSPTNGTQTDTGLGGEVVGNYATLNPLAGGDGVLSNGNLDDSHSSDHGWRVSTIGTKTGKWYAEFTLSSYSNTMYLGITPTSEGGTTVNTPGKFAYINSTDTQFNNVGGNTIFTTPAASVTAGAVWKIALDCDAGKLWFGYNSVWYNASGGTTGDPATGANAVFTGLSASDTFFMYVGAFSASWACNFGQRAFAYQAPSGFKSLCTANLPAPSITKPNTVMDVKLYTGNGASTNTISGLSMSPDLVWLKRRNDVGHHVLYDTVRGALKHLESSTTNAETTEPSGRGLSAFNSDGFTIDTTNGDQTGAGNINVNDSSYVAWTWDAGGSTVTNTSGSISSQVRANATAGFSIVTWTSVANTAHTFGHGLGVAPAMVILKSRTNGSGSWQVGHTSIGWTKKLVLNSTDAASGADGGYWNNTAPSSTVVSIGDANGIGTNNVAYCFAPVAGYSSFGSYTGNGSSSGPFVYTGHRPRFLLLRRTDTIGDWIIHDAARDTYNVTNKDLYPNDLAAENTSGSVQVDFLSNGFRLTSTSSNANGGNYVYASFAESPFNYSRAR